MYIVAEGLFLYFLSAHEDGLTLHVKSEIPALCLNMQVLNSIEHIDSLNMHLHMCSAILRPRRLAVQNEHVFAHSSPWQTAPDTVCARLQDGSQ